MWAWGYNAQGQLGLGNTTNYSSPKQVGSLTDWYSIFSGAYSSFAIPATFVEQPYTQYSGSWKLNAASAAQGAGTWPVPPLPKLYSWGSNTQGELGLGNSTAYSSPKQVGSLTNWNEIARGGEHLVATKTDGTLWVWGYSNAGQLGFGNRTSYSSPKQLGTLTTWSKISGAKYSTFALRTDGSLWSWGYNGNGQLGLGNITDYSSPKQVGSLTNWASLSPYSYFNFGAVKSDGTLWMWGWNDYGMLGLDNRTSYSSPKQVGSLTNWLSVSCGTYTTAAIKTDGTLWTWGRGISFGALGLGNTASYSSPKQVGSLTNWSYVAWPDLYSCVALKTDGTLWAWGNNGSGQLGLGNTTNYSSPKQIGALTNWYSIAAVNGGVIAIKSDGTLWSWGKSGVGQLGLGNLTYYSSPKQVGSLVSWQKISAGGYSSQFSMAIAKT